MKIVDARDELLEKIKSDIRVEDAIPADKERQVRDIIEDVKNNGDRAVIKYTERFDGEVLRLDDFKVSEDEISIISEGFTETFYRALEVSAKRVEEFHKRGIPHDWAFMDEYGDLLGQKFVPIERVGIYVPGGKASYPSTIIMTAVIAKVVGVKEICVISPPSSFKRPSAVAAAIKIIGGITDIYRIGGVQGVAALAFGTESIKRVDKIVGPGNIYVAIAKKLLFGIIDIDMIAGPSEVLVIADGSVNIEFTAADLIAQAEHDEDARPICITFSQKIADEISKKVNELLVVNPRKEIAKASLEKNGVIYIVNNAEKAIELANYIAPEHLEVHTRNPKYFATKLKNAGAIFVGGNSAEAFGDYISGPSHVLPTGGTARFFSPLNVMSFMKISSIIEMSDIGAKTLGSYASIIADMEGLFGHKKSIDIRGEV